MSTALLPHQTLPGVIAEGALSSKSNVQNCEGEQAPAVISFAATVVQRAMRAGLVYERQGVREIAVCAAWRYPEIIDVVREFRGQIYSENGPVDAVRNGRDEHPDDPDSYHVLLAQNGVLRGCARYCRRNKTVQLGGWVIARELRGTRAAVDIIRVTTALARSFGDTHFVAQASVRYGSASILRKLGGRVVAEYWAPAYHRYLATIEIVLPPSER
jgi:hypothetical protein